MKTNTLVILALIVVLLFASQKPEVTPDVAGSPDLTNIVDSSVSFTGFNLYEKGTALTDESVRIIKYNGDNAEKDLGYVSLDSGILSTTPGVDYRFYYFMNNTPSTKYYVQIEDYTAPVQDAVDDRAGSGCEFDTSLVFNSYDESGRRQTSSSNVQSFAAGQTKKLSVRITVAPYECYGMPDIEEKNAICFAYNTATFSKIETDTTKVGVPRAVTDEVSGKGVACYGFDTLQNTEQIEIPVNIVAGATEPTTSHNITIYLKDIAFDLHQTNLAEMYAYEDEDGNILGANETLAGYIYVS